MGMGNMGVGNMGGMMNQQGMPNQQNQGGMNTGGNNPPQDQTPSQQDRPNSTEGTKSDNPSSATAGKTPEERQEFLRKLKEDIAAREREAAELEASIGADKRKNDGEDGGDSSAKRAKTEEDTTAV